MFVWIRWQSFEGKPEIGIDGVCFFFLASSEESSQHIHKWYTWQKNSRAHGETAPCNWRYMSSFILKSTCLVAGMLTRLLYCKFPSVPELFSLVNMNGLLRTSRSVLCLSPLPLQWFSRLFTWFSILQCLLAPSTMYNGRFCVSLVICGQQCAIYTIYFLKRTFFFQSSNIAFKIHYF